MLLELSKFCNCVGYQYILKQVKSAFVLKFQSQIEGDSFVHISLKQLR